MIPPASAMAIRSATLTGYIANATAARAGVDALGEGARAADAADEVDALVRPRVADAQQRLQDLVVQQLDVEPVRGGRPVRAGDQAQGVPLARRGTSRPRPEPDGRVRSRTDADVLGETLEQRLRGVPGEVLHDAVIRQDLGLVVGERDGEERVGLDRAGARRLARAACSRARIALAARWWPSAMYSERDRGIGGDQGRRVAVGRRRQIVCWIPSDAVKSNSGERGDRPRDDRVHGRRRRVGQEDRTGLRARLEDVAGPVVLLVLARASRACG